MTTVFRIGTRAPTYSYALSIIEHPTVEIKKQRLKFLQYCKIQDIRIHVTVNPITMFNLTFVPMVPDLCSAETASYVLVNNSVIFPVQEFANHWRVQIDNRTSGISVELESINLWDIDGSCLHVCPIRYIKIK